MTAIGQKRTIIGLTATVVIFAILAGYGWIRVVESDISVFMADGHTWELQELRNRTLAGTNVAEIASALRYVGSYYRYPEPPPPDIRRHLYNLEERVRTCYQRDIVLHLRELTGDNLGDDPKLWVEKYAKPER